MMFHGSYRPSDVEFLLKPISVQPVHDLFEKEKLIQSGQRHYSEMLTPEKLPSEQYRALFYRAHEQNRERMAHDCMVLAKLILLRTTEHPTIVSLARAGTPVGTILTHLLRNLTGKDVRHYSVSIIRDRGIDANALDAIIARGARPESIVFIDGWTGKGVITEELIKAVDAYNASRNTRIKPDLYVLSDLAGKAHCAATAADYLIPSSILNATISGLVSRSILNEQIGPRDFHGCVYFDEFKDHDLSTWFVDEIVGIARPLKDADLKLPSVTRRPRHAAQAEAFLRNEMKRYGITDRNLIKPGIGEATRVLLRRHPKLLVVRDAQAEDVAHLVALAKEKSVPIHVRPGLPLKALSIIRRALDA